MAHAVEDVRPIVAELCSLVAKLESLFPGRRFTPDGHLVGSIGDILAADRFALTLLPNGAERHDARAADGRLVQIKVTQGACVGLRSEPDHLLVMTLGADRTATDAYNAPGSLAWAAAGRQQRNGQRTISVSKLRALMATVPAQDRLPERAVESS